MGSCNGSDVNVIDSSVGGLVWVRRRNGSWWPGRIMAFDEVSEDNLVSPRSGTPVKLLGREDASIDWYNLEKSKRVKAFRCGEYEECIKKAKASAANGNKKAVKYARREDAILHALEIENSRPAKGPAGFYGPMSLGSKDHNFRGKPTSDLVSGSDSAPEFSQSGISFEPAHHISTANMRFPKKRNKRSASDSEDDGKERIRRMKGLEDLGLGIGDFKLENCLCPSWRRRRTQVANVHEFLKRRNRRRQLTKVLESSAMVSVPVACDDYLPASSSSPPLHGLSDSKVSGLESNESRKSLGLVVNSNSDSTGISYENHSNDNSLVRCKINDDGFSLISRLSENESTEKLFDVPFVDDEKLSTGFCCMWTPSSMRRHMGTLEGQYGQSNQANSTWLKNEQLKESWATSSAANTNMINRIERGSSKWQLKGKRNSRNTHKSRNPEANLSVKSLPSDRDHGAGAQDRTSALLLSKKFTDLKLYDVKLEVRGEHRLPHLPIVSLTSKLNRKSIVGHPVTVEAVSESDYWPCPNISSGKPSHGKRSALPSKKTRKLSLLAGEREREDGKPVLGQPNGLPLACVPLRFIFRNILQAVSDRPIIMNGL